METELQTLIVTILFPIKLQQQAPPKEEDVEDDDEEDDQDAVKTPLQLTSPNTPGMDIISHQAGTGQESRAGDSSPNDMDAEDREQGE